MIEGTPAVAAVVDPPVRYGRLKFFGVLLIGALITYQGLSDVDHALLLGPVWGPRSRILSAVCLGSFYALERYLSRAATWWKTDAP